MDPPLPRLRDWRDAPPERCGSRSRQQTEANPEDHYRGDAWKVPEEKQREPQARAHLTFTTQRQHNTTKTEHTHTTHATPTCPSATAQHTLSTCVATNLAHILQNLLCQSCEPTPTDPSAAATRVCHHHTPCIANPSSYLTMYCHPLPHQILADPRYALTTLHVRSASRHQQRRAIRIIDPAVTLLLV
jgi:hypothetical protein